MSANASGVSSIATDMLRAGYETAVQAPELVRRTYNFLGDMRENAADFLVKRILANALGC
jgi:hypothetical protein